MYKANPLTFTPKIIYTTNDETTASALMNAGWTNAGAARESEEDGGFIDALVSAAPDAADGRGPRFKLSDDGKFQERSKWAPKTQISEYADKFILVCQGVGFEQVAPMGDAGADAAGALE